MIVSNWKDKLQTDENFNFTLEQEYVILFRNETKIIDLMKGKINRKFLKIIYRMSVCVFVY